MRLKPHSLYSVWTNIFVKEVSIKDSIMNSLIMILVPKTKQWNNITNCTFNQLSNIWMNVGIMYH